MRIKTVSVTYERKLNLGNYNSANIGITLWADIPEEDDALQAIPHLQDGAREYVRKEVMRLNPNQTPFPKETQS